MPIVWSGLMPHPPIIVATVGRGRCAQAQATIEACKKLAVDFIRAKPDRLILISPHAPRPRNGIGLWAGREISGDLAQFGAPQTKVRLATDATWIENFRSTYRNTRDLDGEPLDHGTMVPLYFLTEAGWDGPTVVLGLPWDEGTELDRIGQVVKKTCSDAKATAVLASGDMSHCLLPDGPYGFHPSGPEFDRQYVESVRRGAYHEANVIDAQLKHEAKQDVLESSRIAWVAGDYAHHNHHFYSYEGPFGVGYSVSKFFGEGG